MVVVVKSKSTGYGSISGSNTATASHLYTKYNTASLRNLEEWRNKLFVKTRGGYGGGKGNPSEGEKREKGEKEIKNQISEKEENSDKKDEKNLNLSLDVDKVINTLSIHLEKIQSYEKKEKVIDKIKGDIIYKTKDGRVLHAFHSCERGKIIWDENVYDDLKSWLAAANIVAPSRFV
jgi:hypothetical protein